MDRTVNLRGYLPEPFADLAEYRQIHAAEEPELNLLWQIPGALLDRSFIGTADETGISRFEKMLGIVPIDGDTVASRRLRLQTKWITAKPFTMKKLHQILTGLCGADGYALELDGFSMTVKVNLAVRTQIGIVTEMLRHIIPANIALTVTLLYNTWEMFESDTWNQVGEHTWAFLKEGVL